MHKHMTPAEQQIASKYKTDERNGVFGKSVTLWDGDREMGRTFQISSGNWVVESSRYHTANTFKSLSDALDRIVFDWEGCLLDRQRIGEWVIEKMAS